MQWELNLEEAVLHAGLGVNPVAKTYLYFKSSGLPQKTVDDLLRQVHGDMRRFEEVRTLLLRMAHRSMDTNQSAMYEEVNNAYYLDDLDTSWSTVTESSWHDDWNAYYNQDELYSWYEDPNEHYEEEWPEQWNYDAGYDERSLLNKLEKNLPMQPTTTQMTRPTTREKESPDPPRWDWAVHSVVQNGTTLTAALCASRRAKVPTKATTGPRARATTKASESLHTAKALGSQKDTARRASIP